MSPTTSNKAGRLNAFRDPRALDIASPLRFDAICRTATVLFGVPDSAVALIQPDHRWIESGAFREYEGMSSRSALHDIAILADDVFVIEEADAAARLRDDAPAGAPVIRFYASAPLLAEDGRRVGLLWVTDAVPRRFTPEDRARLRDLASVVGTQIALHRARTLLHEREAHYRLIAENTSDMVIWATLDTVRRYVSPAARTLLGYAPEELVGTKPLDAVHPDDSEAYDRLLRDLCDGRIARAVARQRYRRKDGSWVWVEATFNATFDPDGGARTGYVAAVRDITERKQAEHRIAHMARHDALTDLPNRTLFRERLVQEIAASRRGASGFAVLCLDLDRFKAVNDALGHQAGDALLRIVAQRLRALLRAEDTVARIGGDEFMIIQTGPLVAGSIRNLTRRLIDTIAEPVILAGEPVAVGISIGVATAPRDGLDPDTLCRNADMALFEAKRAGRNTFRSYEAGMRFGATRVEAMARGDPGGPDGAPAATAPGLTSRADPPRSGDGPEGSGR